jgi:archaellum component FlaC
LNLFELSAKISVDDSNFKKSMENAQKVSKNVAAAVKNLQSPLDKAKSGFNAIAHPVETAKANIEKLKNATEAIRHPIETFKNKIADASTALETKRNKLSTLAAGYDSAKKKVADITKEFNKSAKESGTSSQKTQELAKKLNEAEKEAEEAKRELDDYSKSVSKAGKNSESASKGVGNFASKLGKGLATAGKVAGAALGVAAAGVAALTTQAVNSFAEYEQLAGGAQKIFDQMDYSKIAKDANNAYKELGLSANHYLAVINDVGATFAATMGDEAGYEAAKTGLKAISDYASGTGKNVDELSQKFTLITRSTSSYQSIADQFSGILPATSKDFLKQAQAAGLLSKKYKDLTKVPIAEYQEAVSKMLEKGVTDLGLANNTMNEAFSTLSGSLSMANGAWSNLVTGLADDSADLDMLIGNFVESVGAVATQLIPKIGTALNGASKLVRDLIPVIVQEIPVLIEENLPILAEAAISIIQSLVDGISQNQEMLMETAFETITYLANSLITMLPQIVQLGLDLIVSLANGIAESLPELIPTIVDVVLQIVETLTNPETLTNLLDAAIVLIENLAYGLMDAIPQLVQAALLIIENLVAFLLDPANLAKLLKMAFDIIVGIGTGLINAIPELLKSVTRIITGIIALFKDADWGKIGKDLVDGFKKGISNAWTNLKKWFKNLFGDLIGIAKKILGIASPSKVFKKIGGFTAEGFGAGFEDEFAHVKDDMEDALNFDDASVGINASIRKVGTGLAGGAFGGTSIGNININIDGAKYSDEQSLAEAVAEAIQSMTDRRAAVYA